MWVARPAPVRKQDARFRRLSRILAYLEPEFRDAVLRALDRLADSIGVRALEVAIRSGVPHRIESVIDWETLGLALLDELEPPMRRALLRGGRLALDDVPGDARLTFDMDTPAARQWIVSHGADLVREVDRNTRLGIRAVTGRMFRQEQPIGTGEAMKRIRDVVGLTRRQATAVENFRAGLEASMRGERSLSSIRNQYRLSRDVRFPAEGLTQARIDKLASDYATRWRTHRAQVIAEQETMVALNKGREQGWQQAVDQGALDPSRDAEQWLTNDPCPICEPMDGQLVPVGGMFTTGEGALVRNPGDPHISCRCDKIIRVYESLSAGERAELGLSA